MEFIPPYPRTAGLGIYILGSGGCASDFRRHNAERTRHEERPALGYLALYLFACFRISRWNDLLLHARSLDYRR